MTDLDLDALEALASAATEGPWEVSTILDGNSRTFIIEDVARWRGYRNSLNLGEDRQTAVFIAAAREAVPALVARVREMEAQRADVLAEVQALEHSDWPRDTIAGDRLRAALTDGTPSDTERNESWG